MLNRAETALANTLAEQRQARRELWKAVWRALVSFASVLCAISGVVAYGLAFNAFQSGDTPRMMFYLGSSIVALLFARD